MRGLLTIEPLYHQIVAGNKTQTRRSGGLDLVNGAKAAKKKKAIIANPDEWEETGSVAVHTKFGVGLESVDFCNFAGMRQKIVCKPRYKIGEVLYLKEPVSINLDPSKNFHYYDLAPDHDYRDRKHFKWPNKLFMPARTARAFIRITAIRCERLLDISDEDVYKEGVKLGWHGSHENYLTKEQPVPGLSAKDSFISLYKFANKIKSSAEIPNLWVFVYEFEYLKGYQLK